MRRGQTGARRRQQPEQHQQQREFLYFCTSKASNLSTAVGTANAAHAAALSRTASRHMRSVLHARGSPPRIVPSSCPPLAPSTCSGTHFTCFTGTKVQVLVSPSARRGGQVSAHQRKPQDCGYLLYCFTSKASKLRGGQVCAQQSGNRNSATRLKKKTARVPEDCGTRKPQDGGVFMLGIPWIQV